MNSDCMHEAAEHALAGSMEAFHKKVVAASGVDLRAPVVTLTWQEVADHAFGYLIDVGLNPLEISKADLAYHMEKVSDGLDYAFGEGEQWAAILNPLMPAPIKKAECTEECWPDCPDGREYGSDLTSETVELLAHPRDCRCPECDGEAPEESRLAQIEDSHLEAEYEDRVSGCDWDF